MDIVREFETSKSDILQHLVLEKKVLCNSEEFQISIRFDKEKIIYV
jgi:hypothetical protein